MIYSVIQLHVPLRVECELGELVNLTILSLLSSDLKCRSATNSLITSSGFWRFLPPELLIFRTGKNLDPLLFQKQLLAPMCTVGSALDGVLNDRGIDKTMTTTCNNALPPYNLVLPYGFL